jgi:hypothetical protein
LIGALSKSAAVSLDPWWPAAVAAALAIGAWVAGLVCAAYAVLWASRQQGEINRGYRLMRQLVEAKVARAVARTIVSPSLGPKKAGRRRHGTS